MSQSTWVSLQMEAGFGGRSHLRIKSEIGVQRATVRVIRSSRSLVGFFLTLLQWETMANFLRRGSADNREVARISPSARNIFFVKVDSGRLRFLSR